MLSTIVESKHKYCKNISGTVTETIPLSFYFLLQKNSLRNVWCQLKDCTCNFLPLQSMVYKILTGFSLTPIRSEKKIQVFQVTLEKNGSGRSNELFFFFFTNSM